MVKWMMMKRIGLNEDLEKDKWEIFSRFFGWGIGGHEMLKEYSNGCVIQKKKS